MLPISPDLAHFLKLARAGYHDEQPYGEEVQAEVMAHAALDHCQAMDDATLRGLTRFIAICRVTPARAAELLESEASD